MYSNEDVIELKNLVKEKLPNVTSCRDDSSATLGGIRFLEFTLDKQFVSIEIHPKHGFGLIANREIVPFEGCDECYETSWDTAARVLEIFEKNITTLNWRSVVGNFIKEKAKTKSIFLDKEYISHLCKMPAKFAEIHLASFAAQGKLKPVLRLRDPDGVILEGEYENKEDFPKKVPNRFHSHYWRSSECDVVYGYNIIKEKWQ